MNQTINDFISSARGAEIALVYYAGHGLQLAGRNYLIPVDARLKTETDVEYNTLELNKVLRPLSQASRTAILLVDACRNNPMTTDLTTPSGVRSTAVEKGLAKVETGRGTLIAFAAAPGQVAIDGTGRNSPFTAALLEHMEKPELEIRQVLTRVRRDVEQATNFLQTPWDNSSLTGDVFLAGVEPEPEPLPKPAPGPDPAALAWNVITGLPEGEQQRRALASFLEQFGSSAYAGVARVMLSTYEPVAEPDRRTAEPNPEPAPKSEPEPEPEPEPTPEPEPEPTPEPEPEPTPEPEPEPTPDVWITLNDAENG